jgi:hypothetical protein
MYYVRQYKAGMSYDPRSKVWAVFHCDICGQDHEVDISRVTDTFQPEATRLCPVCKCHGKNDYVIALKKEIEVLSTTRNSIDVQIEQLTGKLEELNGSSTKG